MFIYISYAISIFLSGFYIAFLYGRPHVKQKKGTIMISKEKKEYNEWYFNVIAKSAINRISEHCKKVDKNFNFNGTEEDFIPLLKYLKEFEKTNALDESLKRDLWTIRNFHDYEKLMEAA